MPLQLAMKVNIVLHYWIGFVGMHLLLTRVIGVTFLPAVIYLATLVPRRARRRSICESATACSCRGLSAAAIVFFLPRLPDRRVEVHLPLGGDAGVDGVQRRHPHPADVGRGAGHLFALFAAFGNATGGRWRSWPCSPSRALPTRRRSCCRWRQFVSGERFWDTRNPTEHPDRVTLDILRQTYLVPTQHVGARLPLQRHGWHEYGNYIGFGSACAAGGRIDRGAARRARGRSLVWRVAGGDDRDAVPAVARRVQRVCAGVLSQHLPLFSSFRIPSRYTIPFLQFAALTVGLGISIAVIALPAFRDGRASLSAIACLGAAAHLIVINQWQLREGVHGTAVRHVVPLDGGPAQITTDRRASAYAPGSPMLRALMENRAFFHCYESLQAFRAALPDRACWRPGPRARSRCDVLAEPCRVRLSAAASRPTRLLNYNWAPGWTSTAGPIDSARPEARHGHDSRPGRRAVISSRSRHRGCSQAGRSSRSRSWYRRWRGAYA